MRQLFIERSSILRSVNERNDALLVFEKGKLTSVIAKKLVNKKTKPKGNFQLKLIELDKEELILRKIYQLEKLVISNALSEFPKFKTIPKIILAPNNVYLFLNKDMHFAHKCYEDMIVFIKKDALNYTNKGNKNHLITEKKIIVSILENSQNLNNIKDEILITVASSDIRSIVDQIDVKSVETSPFLNNIRVRNSELGAHISEAIIPISGYNLARQIRDGNDLHYLTAFKASKTPTFNPEKPKYLFGLKTGGQFTKLNMGLDYPLSNRSKLNLGIELNDQILGLASASLSHKQFLKNNNYLTFRVGKLSQQDLGILLNNQNYNLTNEAVLNLAGYTSLVFDCSSCIKSGLTTGFERHFKKRGSNFGGNYLIQNYSNKTENLAEVFWKKKFKSRNTILLKIKYNIANNFASEFKLSYTIPLGEKNKLDSGNTNADITYRSNTANRITDWLEQDSNIIFMNTPNHLRRNWNNYINFD
ncbi:MAG: hypothetical protein ACJ0BV_11910 [Paracoccaceae bacterium]